MNERFVRMKRWLIQFSLAIFSVIFFHGVSIAQDECKVLLSEINGVYSGGCKKGLANGKGLAKGIDRYEGNFFKGLPHGKGVYTWEDGSVYKGSWKNGKIEGKGTMIYKVAGKDSIVTGFWKEGTFQGKKITKPYKVTYKYNINRYSISKVSEAGSNIRIKIMKAGNYNSDIEDFSLVYDSGEEYELGNMMAIQNIIFPVAVKVKYRTWNLMRTSQFDVIFEFTITEPGTWDITINNY